MEITLHQNYKELNSTISYGEEIVSILNNLEFIQEHIKRFGVTKEFIDLVDKKKELSSVGIKLEADTSTADDGIVGYYEKIKEAIEKFWKMIKEKLTNFFRNWFTSLGWLKSKTKNLYDKKFGSNGKFIDEPEFLKKEVKGFTFDKFKEVFNACLIGLHELKVIKPNNTNGFELSNLDKIVSNLKVIGYEMTEDSKDGTLSVEKKNDLEPSESTIGSLGFTVKNTRTYLDLVDNRIKSLQGVDNIIKTLEDYKKQLKDGKIKATAKSFTSQVNALVKSCSLFAKFLEKMLWYLTNIANKAPLQN